MIEVSREEIDDILRCVDMESTHPEVQAIADQLRTPGARMYIELPGVLHKLQALSKLHAPETIDGYNVVRRLQLIPDTVRVATPRKNAAHRDKY